jgi:hypothetical protein
MPLSSIAIVIYMRLLDRLLGLNRNLERFCARTKRRRAKKVAEESANARRGTLRTLRSIEAARPLSTTFQGNRLLTRSLMETDICVGRLCNVDQIIRSSTPRCSRTIMSRSSFIDNSIRGTLGCGLSKQTDDKTTRGKSLGDKR